jgi:NTE family protein
MVRFSLPSPSWRESGRTKGPSRLRDKGFVTIGEQAGRINLDARLSQALTTFQQSHPDREVLMITPGPHDALLFERSFLSYQDRVHLLRAGYQSVVTLVCNAYKNLQTQFARHGIALERTRFDDRAGSRMAQLDQIVRASSPLGRPVNGIAIGLGDSRTAFHQAK